MAVAAYGAARAVGGRVSGVVSGSSDPGRVAGVILIAGALGLLYLYEQGGLARLFKRTAAAAGVGGDVGAGTGTMSTPQGSGQQGPGAMAEAPPLPPVTQQEMQQYQQQYAHPLTQPQTQQGGGYMVVPPWVLQRPGYATGN